MKKILTILFICCHFLTSAKDFENHPRWTVNPWATTYYISTSGDDITGTGAVGNPWKTLFKATSAVSGTGDLIYVNAGTYTETATSLLAPGVSIEGPDTTSAIIKATFSTDFTPIIKLASATVGTGGNQHISFLKFDGQNLTTAVAIAVYARSNVSIHDISFRDFNFAWGIICGNPNLFGPSSSENEPSTYATGNTIYNIRSMNCAGFDNWGGSWYGSAHLWIPGQKDMVIHDCVMDQTQRATRSNGWLIKATNFTKGIEIYNCSLIRAIYTYAAAGDNNGTNEYWDFGIEAGDVQGWHIHNCTLQGSIDLNRQEKGSYAYSFYFHDNIVGPATLGTGYEHGVILEYQTETAIITNNTFKNISEIIAFSTRSLSYVNHITIANNLAYNIGRSGAGGDGHAMHMITNGSNNYTIDSFVIDHNTFVASPTLTPFYGASFSNAGSIRRLHITNNIFVNFGSSAIGANTAAPLDTVNISYNNFYNNAGNIVWNTGTPGHYTTNSNITTDPLFTNTSLFDYTLQSGSGSKNTASDATDRGYTGGGGYTPPAPTGGRYIRKQYAIIKQKVTIY